MADKKVTDLVEDTAPTANDLLLTTDIESGQSKKVKISTLLNQVAITLGYAQITSNFSTSSTTPVQVTGLSATVTVPAGRRVKITVSARDWYSSGSPGYMELSIWDGAVGSGTKIGAGQANPGNTTVQSVPSAMAVQTPAAGTKTYNVGLLTSAGTTNLEINANYPAFMLVEAI